MCWTAQRAHLQHTHASAVGTPQTLPQVVALHKDRYVFPVSLKVTQIMGTGVDATFMGIMQVRGKGAHVCSMTAYSVLSRASAACCSGPLNSFRAPHSCHMSATHTNPAAVRPAMCPAVTCSPLCLSPAPSRRGCCPPAQCCVWTCPSWTMPAGARRSWSAGRSAAWGRTAASWTSEC